MKCAYIYGLYDPRGDLRNGLFDPEIGIRYIGKTKHKPKIRLMAHISTARRGVRTHISNLIISFLSEDIFPAIKILEICESDLDSEREIAYIAFFRKNGANLTNLTDGGEGLLNPSNETRAKMSASWITREVSDDTRERMSISHMGNNSNLGRKLSDKHRENISNSLKGNKRRLGSKTSDETRKKLSDALLGNTRSLGYHHPKEFGEKMRAIRTGKNILTKPRKK